METHSSTLPPFQPSTAFISTFASTFTNITADSAIANHRYAYDHAGNLTNLISSTATNRYFYNAQNKLVRIEGRGFTNEFAYDSQNRRIGVKLGATWRYDVHDGNLCVASVVNGLLDRFFVRGAGVAEGTGDVIAEIPDPRNPSPHPYYYLSNHRGDTLVVLNDTYTIAARYEYDAFGNVIEKTGSYTPRYTFSTKEYLPTPANGGMYLYAYRVYDPIAGRWTQRDPIDYQDSINLYQFCGNNPINSLDPSGKEATTRLAGAMQAIAGAAVVSVGVTFGTVTCPTIIGGVAGAAIATAGLDLCAAGFTQLVTGEETDTMLSQGLQELGCERQEANMLVAATVSTIGGSMAAANSFVEAGGQRSDIIRYDSKSFVPNTVIKGPGVPGGERVPAIKGGGTNPATGYSLPFHYHIHKYNWYKPLSWFKETPAAKNNK